MHELTHELTKKVADTIFLRSLMLDNRMPGRPPNGYDHVVEKLLEYQEFYDGWGVKIKLTQHLCLKTSFTLKRNVNAPYCLPQLN